MLNSKKTVTSILSAHSKTIKDLLILGSAINKENTRLVKECKAIQVAINNNQQELNRSEAAVAYLDGLFETVNKAAVTQTPAE